MKPSDRKWVHACHRSAGHGSIEVATLSFVPGAELQRGLSPRAIRMHVDMDGDRVALTTAITFTSTLLVAPFVSGAHPRRLERLNENSYIVFEAGDSEGQHAPARIAPPVAEADRRRP